VGLAGSPWRCSGRLERPHKIDSFAISCIPQSPGHDSQKKEKKQLRNKQKLQPRRSTTLWQHCKKEGSSRARTRHFKATHFAVKPLVVRQGLATGTEILATRRATQAVNLEVLEGGGRHDLVEHVNFFDSRRGDGG
jgi:hypothetical protein